MKYERRVKDVRGGRWIIKFQLDCIQTEDGASFVTVNGVFVYQHELVQLRRMVNSIAPNKGASAGRVYVLEFLDGTEIGPKGLDTIHYACRIILKHGGRVLVHAGGQTEELERRLKAVPRFPEGVIFCKSNSQLDSAIKSAPR